MSFLKRILLSSFFLIAYFLLMEKGLAQSYSGQQANVYQADAGVPSQQAANSASTALNSQSQLISNIFLEYYAKQGDNFVTSVYCVENDALVKRNLSSKELKKTIVIFFGDWCQQCHNFITAFSKYVEALKSHGLKLIFLAVPQVHKLRNWKGPTLEEIQEAKDKISSYGINLSSGVSVMFTSGKVALAKSGIEGLPVVIAIKNGVEYFRGVGATGVSKLQFNDPNVSSQFLQIWDDDTSSNIGDSQEEDEDSSNKKQKKKHKKKAKWGSVSKNSTPFKNYKSSRYGSRELTEILNNIWPSQSPRQQPKVEKHRFRGCTCSSRN
ncbi:MAG: thioredoxin family protein [Holosporales bacterium]|jgi:thiol-disulfide isomerase/thioredoxin|nr:thioredoxin family protein [Holosporales bacterium]